MRLFGVRPAVPQHHSSDIHHINDLAHGASVAVRAAATTAAILLVIASAGFGCIFAFTQGAHQGTALAILAVCMALGLEIAKPFAVEAVLASLRTLAVGRALAMLALAIVAVGYSLTAELSLMALTRGDAAAERSKAGDATRDAKAELARITAERAATAFTPATAESVTAAREAVLAAERVRAAECGRRGPNCRAREADEVSARAALATAIANKAATDRAAKLDADAAAVRSRLALAPATAAADPGAAALAAYLAIFGVAVDSSLLAQWLVLVGVIALETGSALSVLLAHAVGGPAGRHRAAILGQPHQVAPEPETAAVEAPQPQARQETAPVSKKSKGKHGSPTAKRGRGRPPRERQEAEARIIELAKASGGKLSKNSVRKLGSMAKASKGTTVNAVASLIAGGVFVKTAAGLVLGA